MSYAIVSAVGMRKTSNEGWLTISPSNVLIEELLGSYRRVLIKMTNTFLADPIIFDLTANRHLFTNTMITFGTWLNSNANTALQSLGKDFSISKRTVNFGDASQYDYNVKLVHPIAHPDSEVLDSEKTDFLLTKSDIDYTFMGQHALVSINGFYHLAEASQYGIYVRKARLSRDVANDNLVGILSFANVGTINVIPFTDDMILKNDNDDPLSASTIIKLPVSTVGKSVLLSIGGYLHVMDNTYREIGDGLIELQWRKIPLAERAFEMASGLDISDIIQYYHGANKHAISPLAFKTDAYLKALLKMSQSFVVVIDNPNLMTTRKHLPPSDIPGVYDCPTMISSLVVGPYGRGMTYNRVSDWGRWVLRCEKVYNTAYTFQTTDWLETGFITDAVDTNQPVRVATATAVDIFFEDITFTP